MACLVELQLILILYMGVDSLKEVIMWLKVILYDKFYGKRDSIREVNREKLSLPAPSCLIHLRESLT